MPPHPTEVDPATKFFDDPPDDKSTVVEEDLEIWEEDENDEYDEEDEDEEDGEDEWDDGEVETEGE